MKVAVYHGSDGSVCAEVRWGSGQGPRFRRGLREIVETEPKQKLIGKMGKVAAVAVPPTTNADIVISQSSIPPPTDVQVAWNEQTLDALRAQLRNTFPTGQPVEVPSEEIRAPEKPRRPSPLDQVFEGKAFAAEGRVIAQFILLKTANRSGYSTLMKEEVAKLLKKEQQRKFQGVRRRMREKVRNALVAEIYTKWLMHPHARWHEEVTQKGYYVRIVPCPNQHRSLFFLLDVSRRIIVGVHTPTSFERASYGREARRRQYRNTRSRR